MTAVCVFGGTGFLGRRLVQRLLADGAAVRVAVRDPDQARSALRAVGLERDEKEQKINIHYDGSTYPNWDGEDQVRLISIKGDELSIVSPVSAVGGGSVHLVLRRARPPNS